MPGPNREVLQPVAIPHLSTRVQGHHSGEQDEDAEKALGEWGGGVGKETHLSRACGEAESQGLCGAVQPVSRPTRPPPGLSWEAELVNVTHTFPRGTGLSLFLCLSCTPQPCTSPDA